MRPHVRANLDPLDVEQLPPTAGMCLDYRTQPLGPRGERVYATRVLVQMALLALGAVILVRLVAFYLGGASARLQSFALYFWCIALPVCGVIALRGSPRAAFATTRRAPAVARPPSVLGVALIPACFPPRPASPAASSVSRFGFAAVPRHRRRCRDRWSWLTCLSRVPSRIAERR